MKHGNKSIRRPAIEHNTADGRVVLSYGPPLFSQFRSISAEPFSALIILRVCKFGHFRVSKNARRSDPAGIRRAPARVTLPRNGVRVHER